MKTLQFNIKSRQTVEMINIDRQIKEMIHNQSMKDGICLIFVPHTTAGVTINENADPDVVRDIIKELNVVIPFSDNYQHIEGNSAAHIKSSLISPSLNIIVEDGRLLLGTWQSIFFCEFDGPRTRRVFIKLIIDG